MKKCILLITIISFGFTLTAFPTTYTGLGYSPGTKVTCHSGYVLTPNENFVVNWSITSNSDTNGEVFAVEYCENPFDVKVWIAHSIDSSVKNYFIRLVCSVFEDGVLVKTDIYNVSVQYPSDPDPFPEEEEEWWLEWLGPIYP